MTTFLYSVVQAVPRPRRDERINLGVVVLASDGSFGDVRMSSLSRVRKLDQTADLSVIEKFVGGIASRVAPDSRQATLVPGLLAEPLSAKDLAEWSREFGGQVRLTQPRAALADSGVELVKNLYRDFVGAPRRFAAAEELRIPKVVRRSTILRVLDQQLALWNVAAEAIEAEPVVHGSKAEHLIDRAYYGPHRRLQAIAQAISFQTKDLADVYADRATIIVAAEDIHERRATENLAVFAVYSDAPHNRATAIEESAKLFRARQVTPVGVRELSPLRRVVDSMLQAEVLTS